MTNYIIDLAHIPGVPDEPLKGDECYYIAPVEIKYPRVDMVRVSIVNTGSTRKVITLKKTGADGAAYTAEDTGPLFSVEEASLSIDGRIILDGLNAEQDGIDNTAPLVSVKTGYLELKGRARIEANTNAGTGNGAQGGGVYLESSSFVMKDDAAVVNNSVAPAGSTAAGGGIYAATSSLTITGNADISYNTAIGGRDKVSGNTFNAQYAATPEKFNGLGGGICIADHSVLVMSGKAAVKNNEARGISFNTSCEGAAGGGIAMSGEQHKSYCVIQLSGDVSVSDNIARGYNCAGISIQANTGAAGGGIYIREKSNLTIEGNVKIGGNTAEAGNLSTSSHSKYAYAEGGGVSSGLYQYLSITIKDNVCIKDNKATGGSINNENVVGMWLRAYGRGGGIAVGDYSAFTMTGGEISGNSAEARGIEGRAALTDDYFDENNHKVYSTGGGIYISEGGTLASISGGVIRDNTAGAPGRDHYGAGGAVYLANTYNTSVLKLSGSVSIPANEDTTDDTEDSRNTVASERKSTHDTSNDNPFPSSIYILLFTTDETITLDIMSITPNTNTAGNLISFVNSTRVLWYDEEYPDAANRPDMPVRFVLGDFIALDTNSSTPDTYYKYKHTPLDGYTIGDNGKIKQK